MHREPRISHLMVWILPSCSRTAALDNTHHHTAHTHAKPPEQPWGLTSGEQISSSPSAIKIDAIYTTLASLTRPPLFIAAPLPAELPASRGWDSAYRRVVIPIIKGVHQDVLVWVVFFHKVLTSAWKVKVTGQEMGRCAANDELGHHKATLSQASSAWRPTFCLNSALQLINWTHNIIRRHLNNFVGLSHLALTMATIDATLEKWLLSEGYLRCTSSALHKLAVKLLYHPHSQSMEKGLEELTYALWDLVQLADFGCPAQNWAHLILAKPRIGPIHSQEAPYSATHRGMQQLQGMLLYHPISLLKSTIHSSAPAKPETCAPAPAAPASATAPQPAKSKTGAYSIGMNAAKQNRSTMMKALRLTTFNLPSFY
ncbi:hypothetical protein DFP72DRAFT_844384 [Ephemerocybe angulata]|uniref:Uncharacterized protein n=1 Tax=Ephemerocybe angulata TaxID=980116 RepID=A0A8H6MAQ4_9AGAR|nr:hypothetical protein DFP72DRAFT_844384 [Tulosesus angulatus]